MVLQGLYTGLFIGWVQRLPGVRLIGPCWMQLCQGCDQELLEPEASVTVPLAPMVKMCSLNYYQQLSAFMAYKKVHILEAILWLYFSEQNCTAPILLFLIV